MSRVETIGDEVCGEPLSAECGMCGEMVLDHPAVVECFETFGELYCEFCSQEAMEDEDCS